ncbi:MAG: TRAP transporter substrate-binding protein [Deltaproteobacteria bacterium]|nr:TRAP transporter substrate-binding protein [Deltaproteobacteria bacterium]
MRSWGLLVALLLGCLVVLGTAGGAAAGAEKFTFAHFVPPNEPGAEAGLWIEKDLNQNSGGLVKAKYYHSMQMGSTIELVKKVRMGTLKAGVLTGNYAPDLNPKFGIGTLAYCMDSYAKWDAFLRHAPLRDELFNCLSDKGLLVLDICYFGLYGLTTTQPVNTLEDLKSMKMRTTQARYPLAFWKALGVNPVTLAWGDVLPALKQGVIEGTDQTRNVARLRLADVCKYFTETNHMVGLFILVVNKRWYEKLDPKVRKIITDSIHRNYAKARAASEKLTREAPDALKAKGVKVLQLSPEQVKKFKGSQKVVWKKFAPEIGQDWLDRVNKFAEKFE